MRDMEAFMESKFFQYLLKGSQHYLLGSFTLPKSSLERGAVEAKLEDFDFDLPLKVKSFRFRAPGQPSAVIQGNKLDSKAIRALSRIKNGQTIIISDIEVIIPSNPSYKLKQTSPISITIN